jgi:hypothetical protein
MCTVNNFNAKTWRDPNLTTHLLTLLQKFVYISQVPMHAMYPIHVILIDLTKLDILAEECQE